jgi:AraC-like DNA-binding protein
MFFLFAAVLLLLFIPVFQYITGFTRNNELLYIQDRLNRGIEAFDGTLTGLFNTVKITGEDPRFRRFKYDIESMRDEYFLLDEIQKDFNSLLVSKPLIADAGIIFPNDLVLSRHRSIFRPNLYTYYPTFLECDQHSWEEWKALLLAKRPFSPARYYRSQDFGTYEAITYAARWYKGDVSGVEGESVFFAALPVNAILPLLADNDTLSHGFIRIKDLDGNNILEYPPPPSGEAENFTPYYYYILSSSSNTTPLYFEVGVSKELIKNKMTPVRNRIFLFVLFAAFFTISLALLFAYKGSEPMRKLIAGINTGKYIGDEYERPGKTRRFGFLRSFRRVYLDISRSIATMNAELDHSSFVIEEQTGMLRSMVFKRALYHGLYEKDDLQNFRTMFPDFPKRFQIALINCEIPPDIPLEEKAILRIELKNAIPQLMGAPLFIVDMENALVLFLPVPEGEDNRDRQMKVLQNGLTRQTKVGLTFALSDVFEKDIGLYQAWQQVKMNNIPEQRHIANMVIGMLQMIYDSIKNGNEKAACTILEESLSKIPLAEDSVLSEMIYNMISNMVLLVKAEYPSFLGNINVPVFVWDKREDLYKKQFPRCLEEICENIRKNKTKSVSKIGGDVLNYINAHLDDPSLYIPAIADHFNISAPTLQKLVKDLSGETVSAYIESNRLKKAWEMLSSGGYSMAAIAEASGFANINSFYKTFRRVYGTAPGKVVKKTNAGH